MPHVMPDGHRMVNSIWIDRHSQHLLTHVKMHVQFFNFIPTAWNQTGNTAQLVQPRQTNHQYPRHKSTAHNCQDKPSEFIERICTVFCTILMGACAPAIEHNCWCLDVDQEMGSCSLYLWPWTHVCISSMSQMQSEWNQNMDYKITAVQKPAFLKNLRDKKEMIL